MAHRFAPRHHLLTSIDPLLQRVGWCALRGAVVALLTLAACGEGTPVDERSVQQSEVVPLAVTVSSAIRTPIRRELSATGTLNADEETIVAAKVTGRIVELRVDLGDEAEVGAMLAQIDPIDATLALDERRFALSETLTQLGLGPEERDALDSIDAPTLDRLPAVQRARRQADNARARLDRSEILMAQEPPLISAQDHADLQTAWEVAEQDHQLALLSVRATLARARTLNAQVASAERILADTRVLAPQGAAPPLPQGFADGEVSWDRERRWSVAERLVSVGTLVQPGTPLFRLVDVNPLKLRVSIPEHRIGLISAGAVAKVHAEGAVAEALGLVLRIAPVVDPRTRTFGVEIIVPNEEGHLRPGGFARASIGGAGLDEVVLVPADALVIFAGVEKIFFVSGDAAAERRVETGALFGDLVEIRSGVEPDLLVIRNPPRELLPGRALRVAERVTLIAPSTGSAIAPVDAVGAVPNAEPGG